MISSCIAENRLSERPGRSHPPVLVLVFMSDRNKQSSTGLGALATLRSLGVKSTATKYSAGIEGGEGGQTATFNKHAQQT